jgi:hypothetical protein
MVGCSFCREVDPRVEQARPKLAGSRSNWPNGHKTKDLQPGGLLQPTGAQGFPDGPSSRITRRSGWVSASTRRLDSVVRYGGGDTPYLYLVFACVYIFTLCLRCAHRVHRVSPHSPPQIREDRATLGSTPQGNPYQLVSAAFGCYGFDFVHRFSP